jgi:hypothetical protein
MAVLSMPSVRLGSASLAAQHGGRAEIGIREARPQVHKAGTLVREVKPMNRRNWLRYLVAGAAIVIIAVVATLLLVQEEAYESYE